MAKFKTKNAEMFFKSVERNALAKGETVFYVEHIISYLMARTDIIHRILSPILPKRELEAFKEAIDEYTCEMNEDTDGDIDLTDEYRFLRETGENPLDIAIKIFNIKNADLFYNQYLSSKIFGWDKLAIEIEQLDPKEILGTLGKGMGKTPNIKPNARKSGSLDFCKEITFDEKINTPHISRDKEIAQMCRVLLRKNKSNPLILGEAGVGKTALVNGLVEKIAKGLVPTDLKGARVFGLDTSGLISGCSLRGEFEERVKEIFDNLEEISENETTRPILFIDEIHSIIGMGNNGGSGGGQDLANMMKPLITEGKFSVIGATTFTEYETTFKKDEAMVRRFYPISLVEPTKDETIKIIEGIKEKYEEYHKVTYSADVIKHCVDLSARYITDKKFPDKAIDIIDEVGAKVKIAGKTIVEKVDIEDVVSERCKVPVGTVGMSETERLKNLETNLLSRVFGQDEAVKKVAKDIRMARALPSGTKPISNLLFVGTTGTGKTELAKAVAKELSMELIKIDCSELNDSISINKLIGSSAGYVGYEEGGKLINKVNKCPYSVVLFDEIEKAHPDIFNLLLQVMEDGRLTDGKGREANFSNCIIILTTNAGATNSTKRNIGFGCKETKGVEEMSKAVNTLFAPEFINRLSAVIRFNDVGDVATLIINKELNLFKEELSTKNIKLSWNDDVVQLLSECGVSANTGARQVKREITEKLRSEICDEILFGKLANGGSVKLSVKGNEIKFSYRGNKTA